MWRGQADRAWANWCYRFATRKCPHRVCRGVHRPPSTARQPLPAMVAGNGRPTELRPPGSHYSGIAIGPSGRRSRQVSAICRTGFLGIVKGLRLYHLTRMDGFLKGAVGACAEAHFRSPHRRELSWWSADRRRRRIQQNQKQAEQNRRQNGLREDLPRGVGRRRTISTSATFN